MDYPLGQRLRDMPGPVLLTGHTGFKGTWMTFLLEYLGIPVVGYSLHAEKESLFGRAARTGAIPEEFLDIRDYAALEQFIDLHKPSTIIHMAAQPIVLQSYENPRETFDVNVMGTVNVLDIAFKKDFVKAIIVVTTDKVYGNDNSGRAFIETDSLEGKDPYSASKVGTEAVVSAWQHISKVSSGPRLVSVRAGNVIGGGDFAKNRIIPDLVRGLISGNPTEIRNPNSTRPWQHVLDPLVGYLLTIEKSLELHDLDTLNFGSEEKGLKVSEVIKRFAMVFDNQLKIEFVMRLENESHHSKNLEASQLILDSSLSKKLLNWVPVYSQEEAIDKTAHWWLKVIKDKASPAEISKDEINEYFSFKGQSNTWN